MVTHRLFRSSYVFYYFSLFFTGQLNVLAYLFSFFFFFLLANSACWPVMMIFFTGQLSVLACHDFFYWPTQRVGLS